MLTKIISGGQTGVDRGALDAALELGMEVAGWFRAGAGPKMARYRSTILSRKPKVPIIWCARSSM